VTPRPDTVVKGQRKPAVQKLAPAAFLGGGGEMGRRMRALDWAHTPLGSAERWPTSLRTAVRILLTARQPMFLFWGERGVTLYNDAAKGIVSAKHPHVLGQQAAAAWQEIWAAIGERVQSVAASNEAAYDDSILLPVETGGASVNARFAMSFSPIPDDAGDAGGVLCVLNETESFHEAVIGLSSELDVQSLLQKVTDVATRVTRARFGAFFYNARGEDGAEYQLFTVSGAERSALEKLARPTPLFESTFRGEGVIRLDDVLKDPRYGKYSPPRGTVGDHLLVRSYLAVPVVSRNGDVLGGLFFAHAEPAMFDERAERNARAIAAHAAVAIDNANLFGIARGEIEERSRVEIALRDSERRYRDVVQGLPAAIYTTDGEGRIQLFNEAAVELWGRRPECGVELWCGSFRIFDASGSEVLLSECPMARVLKGEPLSGGHAIVIERPDGTRRHALAHPRPIHDSTGTVIGAVNMIVDITERNEAERELARTRDELELQVKSLTSMHEMATQLAHFDDIDAAMQMVLDTAVEVHGADLGLLSMYDEPSGTLVAKASHGFDPSLLEEVGRIIPGVDGSACGRAFDSRARVIVFDTEADSSYVAYREFARRAGFRSVQSTPIVTRGGRLLGVLSVHFSEPRVPATRELQLCEVCARHVADAIEHNRSTQAVRESERLYRAIGESINYGVWVCDAAGRNAYVSESFLKLTGLTQAEYAKSIWSRIPDAAEAERVRASWKECIAAGRDWEAEVQVTTAAGGTRAILSRGVAIRDESGQITGWAGMNLDIDRLKRVENELRELDQRKNEFLATLAHELRNPLAPIRNGLEIMRLGRGNPGMVEQARTMMERQLRQMVRLVDDLLDVSRVSRGKIELRKERIDLSSALSNAIETAKPIIDQNGQELVTRLPGQPITVDGDLTRLSQVFANLLNNAAKYTDKGGRIELTVHPHADRVEVRVKDNGIGIPPAMLEKIFGIFTQVERSLEKARGGLGIGLSIAKRLVEMHGGAVIARSDGPGHGSEFVVWLPVVEEAQEARATPAAAPSASAHRRRVLIADDNIDAASSLSLMLQVMGNDVRVAHDGLEALAVAEAFHPDAILLDIGMPGLNGYEVCRKLRERGETSRALIIALTGWGQEDDRRRSRDFGFDQHLVKPVEPSTLAAALGREPVARTRKSD
jgi:PAS domain S-box-containing protein